jgi:hypothetical protein
MNKIIHALTFFFLVLQGSDAYAATPVSTCAFHPRMGQALEVLSQLDAAYQYNRRSDFAWYINNLIQTGQYPGQHPGIPGFAVVTGGISTLRSADNEENCVMSKAIIRTVMFARDINVYDTVNHYRQALENLPRSPTYSYKNHQHLLTTLLTAELSIAKKMELDAIKAATVRQGEINAALSYNAMVAQQEAARQVRHAQWKTKCGPRDAACEQRRAQRRAQRHASGGGGRGGGGRRHGHRLTQVAVPPAIVIPNLITTVIDLYGLRNGDNQYGPMANWVEMLVNIANSATFNKAFDMVSLENGW